MTDEEISGTNSRPPGPDVSDDDHPSQIGPYRILDTLGEGGMSVVYLAEQSEPVKRRVALKILKPGMDSKQVVARFESERQALAVLDHPNIAKIFDGGIAESGRPYFAMEQVKGVPITDYCDDQRLNNEERLKVFIKVCSAVQHAHLKGLIHRDLKPSNILVGVVDGEPQPKIIDFGIAKATTTTLTEATLYTRVGQIIGTPQYMSPEQANLTGLDIDTRTDIYSLGVVLYELLVGTVPLDLRAIGDQAMQVAIRERVPSKPSTRFTGLGDTREEVATVRGTNPDRLRQQLMGDLDWIVMCAIEKDRTRRYETVNALAMECRRFLKHEPVLARPPSPGYLLQRFVRRNRVTVVAGSIAILAIILGAVAATEGMVRAQRAERLAEAEAATSNAINEFLQETLGSAAPWRGGSGREVTVVETLDTALLRIDDSFTDQPLIAAALRATIGGTYLRLGQFEQAEPLFESSLEVRRSLLGDEHEDVAESLQYFGVLRQRQGRFGESEPMIARALEIYRKRLGEKHPRTMEALADHGVVLTDLARYDEATPIKHQVLEFRRGFYGDEHKDVGLSLSDLGWLYLLVGEWEESERLLRESAEMFRKLLDKARPHETAAIERWLALSLQNLGAALNWRGKLDEAEASYREALEINRRIVGDDHPHVASNLVMIAAIISSRDNNYDEALALTREAIDLRRRVQGDNSAAVAGDLLYLATIHTEKGDLAAAVSVVRESVEIYRHLATEGNGVPDWYASALNNMGANLLLIGECTEALPYLEEAIEVYESLSGGDPANTGNTRSHYGACLTKLGRYQDAEATLLAAYAAIQPVRGDEHLWTTRTADRLVALYEVWGKADEAEKYRR